MSSILKALEKAEEANSPKRVAGEHDMIRSRQTRPVWVMPAAVLCGACVATLATFVAMGGFSKRSAPANPVTVTAATPSAAPVSQPVATPPAAVAPQPAPVTAGPVLSPAPQATAASPIVHPSGQVKTAAVAPGAVTSRPVPLQSKAAAPVAKAVASAKSPAAALTDKQASSKAAAAAAPLAQPATVQTAPAPAPAATPAAAQPKVSGIAWQGNGESSFAVVNGRAVLQGGVVDGYKVTEIHPDRVRFSGSSGSFEVPMGTEDK
jgi:general secretion pathway protein B